MMTHDWIFAVNLNTFFSEERLLTIGAALATVVVGVIAAKLLSGAVVRALTPRLASSQVLLARRFVTYTVVILSIVSALRSLGVDLGIFVGAAGLLTVALGFASQTSASNLISGIFLLAERPFAIGDAIRVGTTTGRVVAVDVLSVKLCTYDNLYVRIPNETLLKSEITNLTHYPVRRLELFVNAGYEQDLATISDLLKGIAQADIRILDNPTPQVRVTELAASTIQLQFVCWATRENYADVLFSVRAAIAKAFIEQDIPTPYPHQVVEVRSTAA